LSEWSFWDSFLPRSEEKPWQDDWGSPRSAVEENVEVKASNIKYKTGTSIEGECDKWCADQERGEDLMETPERNVHRASQTDNDDEDRKIRRLQIMMDMVMSVICQDVDLTIEEASELVAGTRRAALAMFPDKELAYDILYKPRLQRLLNERFHLQ
jgi:hypothetical protein